MRRILFTAAAFVLTGTLVATAQDAKPAQPAVQPKAVQPGLIQPRAIAVPAARMMQLEEDFETAEAHRDVKKAYVKAAEAAVQTAEARLDLVAKAAVVSAGEVNVAKSELMAAKAQVEIRMAELKESEVKVKFAKKRLDDAKAAGVRPLPGGLRPVPVDPTPNVRFADDEKAFIELKARLDKVAAQLRKSETEGTKAAIELKTAEAALTQIKEIAMLGKVKAGTIEAAEAKVAEAKAQVDKLSKERKALDEEIAAIKKKLAEIGK